MAPGSYQPVNFSGPFVQAQYSTGYWGAAIPLPYFLSFGRKRCGCGETFWTSRGYEGHYALEHILLRKPERADAVD